MDEDLRRKLELPIGSLDFSVRTRNSLEAASIITIHDLARRSEAEVRRTRTLGKTGLYEVKRKLSAMGLRLGMTTRDRGLP
jgi:DNA-directed RNA polymerase subunit alpha